MVDEFPPTVTIPVHFFRAIPIPECPPHPDDSRYPYTHAADLLRTAGYEGGLDADISRSQASRIRYVIAQALGIDDAVLAQVLATYFLAHRVDLTQEVVRKRALAGG